MGKLKVGDIVVGIFNDSSDTRIYYRVEQMTEIEEDKLYSIALCPITDREDEKLINFLYEYIKSSGNYIYEEPEDEMFGFGGIWLKHVICLADPDDLMKHIIEKNDFSLLKAVFVWDTNAVLENIDYAIGDRMTPEAFKKCTEQLCTAMKKLLQCI